MPKISILHPSWQRPQLARQCYDEWMGKADNPDDIEYVLCLSAKDTFLDDYHMMFANLPTCHVISDNGLVKQVNHAATYATGDLIIGVSDDFGCPYNWDTLLLNALRDKQDYIVKTQDGIQPFIITLPIMDRMYYDRFGYIYHPSYFHMYADQELADVGKKLNKTITLPIMFPHRHYTTGQMKKDATNVQNDSYYKQDEIIYNRRKAANFGLQIAK